jgi:hypothetical protein
VLPVFQKRVKIREFGDQPVLRGAHLVGALAFTLKVRPVTGRPPLFDDELRFEAYGCALEAWRRSRRPAGDHVVTGRAMV